MKTISEIITEQLTWLADGQTEAAVSAIQSAQDLLVADVFDPTAVAVEGDDLRFLLEWARNGLLSSFDVAAHDRLDRIAAKYSEVEG